MRSLVDKWLQDNSLLLNSREIAASVKETHYDPCAVIVDLDGPDYIGTFVMWENGAAEVQVGAISDGTIVVNRTAKWSSDDELRELLQGFLRTVVTGGGRNSG